MILRLATHAMGTRFELVLDGKNARNLRAVGEAALAEIEECHRRFNLFAKDSLLALVNREAARRWVRVDAEAFRLLVLCAEVAEASRGAFDPSVAPLMRDYGFHHELAQFEPGGPGQVGWQHVELDPRERAIRFHHRGMSLDLGGVAKGHGLDLAARVLREEGISCALLQGGSSTVLALGSPPGQEAWRVGLAPTAEAPVACLEDAALSVSATTGRQVHRQGQMLGHVMDPISCRPAAGKTRRAAVLAGDAGRADAWSTAMLVRGPELLPPPGIQALLASDGDDGLCWQLSPAGRVQSPGSHFLLSPKSKKHPSACRTPIAAAF